ncbi:hypothetical protein ACIBHX_41240 [Nonomuraea sp. NPDC050536]
MAQPEEIVPALPDLDERESTVKIRIRRLDRTETTGWPLSNSIGN